MHVLKFFSFFGSFLRYVLIFLDFLNNANVSTATGFEARNVLRR